MTPKTHRAGRESWLRQLYLDVYDRLFRRPVAPLAAVLLLAGVGAVLVPRVSLDMSFRPLFGQEEAALEATADFEESFGQRSGAYIGAILTPGSWDASFVEALAQASRDVAALSEVSEVVSLARAAVAVGSGDEIVSSWLVDPGELESVDATTLTRILDLRTQPGVAGRLVSLDGERTVLLARLDLPLSDLQGRTQVIRRFKQVVGQSVADSARPQWVGISVVEEAYARLVLRGIAISLLLTTAVLLGVLFAIYRRAGAVAVVMSGVSLSLPVAVAAMVVRGQAITIVNSMVPTMILIIGVADAIHMFECFAQHLRRGRSQRDAVRMMFGDMALPCLLTSLTTIGGVLALQTAGIEALRDFGGNVAVGIVAVYMANLLALPSLLLLIPEDRLLAARRRVPALVRWRARTVDLLVRKPGLVAAAVGLAALVSVAGAGRVEVDQRFNEDVAAEHPVRAAQALYETEFHGILGPDVEVRRRDGGPILRPPDIDRIRAAVGAIETLPGVLSVESVLDFDPWDGRGDRSLISLVEARADVRIGERVRDVVDESGTRTVLIVRTADVGSSTALELASRIEAVTNRKLGPAYEVRIVGQWWLAQLGLSGLLRDMLVGFATSFLVVLPIMAFALGDRRLFAVAIAPNLLPPLFALGFMGWTGISVRVGTAMILAIALAIAVDDSIHVLVRLARERRAAPEPRMEVRRMLEHVWGPLSLTTVVLVAGFLSMITNGLVAIRDMGIVAAATLSVAFLADVYLLPALYLLGEKRPANADSSLPSAIPLRSCAGSDASNDVCGNPCRAGSLGCVR